MELYTFYRSVQENLKSFWEVARQRGYDRQSLLRNVPALRACIPTYRLNQLQDYARGAMLPLEELICFDQYSGYMFPEDCTVYFATGKASKSGYTVFGKNSDKSGDRAFDSKRFYRNREINVVAYYHNPDGSHVVGVAAAGSTGLKMGMNSYGVAVGTNYGETKLAAQKELNPVQQLAGDRALLAREALTERSALQAAQKAVHTLLEHPMTSSGTLEFADAREVYIVENAYDYTAIKRVRDDVDARANFFNLLPELNLEGNVSSFCRYHRALELLKGEAGTVCAETLRNISMDHKNGPGGNSICRHSSGMDSATLSAAIMEIDGEVPERSVIHITLGTPCHGWREEQGSISISMDMPEEKIPSSFRTGEAFCRFCLLDSCESSEQVKEEMQTKQSERQELL